MTTSRRDLMTCAATLAGGLLAPSVIARRAEVISPALEDAALERIEGLVDAAVGAHHTPGISLSIWQNGTEVYSRTAGMANLELAARVTHASVFRIGSVTKQFAGALILKLVSAGKLSLTDPARKYLAFLSPHEPFTILELLNHTAGVRDGDYDLTQLQSRSQIDLAQLVALQKPFFDFQPGTAWLYSNANYILIGAIIEQVSKMPLADAAASLLFRPLSLTHTAFDVTGDIVPGRASGYSPTGNTNTPFRNADYLDVSWAGAAGAMRSTAADLCRWHHALFHNRALPAALVKLMTAPGRLRNGRLASTNRYSEDDKGMGDTQYGLGLMLDNATVDRSPIAGHHGGINGFTSYLAGHLASGLSYACLCNVDTHSGLPFRDIRRTVFASLMLTGKA